ncbi:hypothetical protein EM6_0487 [Asticcacaulis excentricus]|uniref:Uncharacterized protein n=1 Tax=Asticcacaulis excentricus TaxID=78587 RepID=A0A3G9FXZ7_9CAUL|nr:hypothetical protein EM6_0487 [Asticcacaulis excentricus]
MNQATAPVRLGHDQIKRVAGRITFTALPMPPFRIKHLLIGRDSLVPQVPVCAPHTDNSALAHPIFWARMLTACNPKNSSDRTLRFSAPRGADDDRHRFVVGLERKGHRTRAVAQVFQYRPF